MAAGPQRWLSYQGLAPFLRASIAGEDLRAITQDMLHLLDGHGDQAELLMNLAMAFQCLNQQEMGLRFQQEALSIQRNFCVQARLQPARLRLLVLVAAGSMQANSPLECLLEVSDIALEFYFLAGEASAVPQSLAALPAHDVLFVGLAESEANRPVLDALAQGLAHWKAPVLNRPEYLYRTGRDQASVLLQGIDDLLVPQTRRVARPALKDLAEGRCTVGQLLPGADFPLILRPLGSQAGKDLEKIDSPEGVAIYLQGLNEQQFFMAPFIDYRNAQGQYCKIRVALVEGQAFVCHMGVSGQWMVHYVNAGMYQDADKRALEARFMQDFDRFVERHQGALQAICSRMQLDYLVMDCAQTAEGGLLLFEIDHGGVVHAMDVDSLFPYKNQHIRKVQRAFEAMLQRHLPQA